MEAMAFSHWLSEKKERYQATVQGGSLLTQMHRYFAAFGKEGNKWEKKSNIGYRWISLFIPRE